MSYRRSYNYTTTTEQREKYKKKVNKVIDIVGFCRLLNDYPYDMCRDKKVKTKHITIFYRDFDKVAYNIDMALKDGYTVIINSSENQTIPEINHLHFIKIIDE